MMKIYKVSLPQNAPSSFDFFKLVEKTITPFFPISDFSSVVKIMNGFIELHQMGFLTNKTASVLFELLILTFLYVFELKPLFLKKQKIDLKVENYFSKEHASAIKNMLAVIRITDTYLNRQIFISQ